MIKWWYTAQIADLDIEIRDVDLKPFLKEGENIIAAEVMNWGSERSYGIISNKTAFLLQGHTPEAEVVNTTKYSDWKVSRNESIHEKTVYWIGGKDIIGGFYAGNPMDSIVANKYQWGWKQLSFDDEKWHKVTDIFGSPNLNTESGMSWGVQPRTTAIQTNRKQPFAKVIRNEVGLSKDFKFGDEPVRIPANTKTSIVIDQGEVTLGFPKLTLTGGADAEVRMKYGEAMYNNQNKKGNRNELEGKFVKGVTDVLIADGGKDRSFQPIWFRAFRFIELEITTQDDPLIIEDFYNLYSASEFEQKGSVTTDNQSLNDIWGICQHTLELCAQDNLLSDIYYEQMQYVGDLRPHLKAWTALTGDFTYFKSAMQQFNNSRLPNGNVTSCYPNKATFLIPPYSLIWIDMLHDYMMQTGDKEFVGQYV